MISKVINEDKNNERSSSKENGGISKDVFVIAQEIKIIKSLAGNDCKQRDKQLKKLGKWFNLRSKSSFAFLEDDFLRIWKGLYYCMWMSDKPLVQESLAENLGKLINSFENIEDSIKFFGAFLKTMKLEWFGIDQWRMDKFMMLIRKMFRYMFYAMNNEGWSKDCIEIFNKQLTAAVLEGKDVVGVTMHISDIFLEELGKVAGKNLTGKSVAELLKPFVMYLAKQHDLKLMRYIKNRIFYNWLWQSEKGREHNEKFNAWKEMGFPTHSIDELEKVEESNDEMELDTDERATTSAEKHLDPRAGGVDVFIPELAVDVSSIISLIEEIQFKEITNTKSRKTLRIILEKYKTYESGGFPLGIKEIPKPSLEPLKGLIDEKVQSLEKLEDELYSTSRNLRKLSKKRRKRILASINLNDHDEETFEQALKGAVQCKKRTFADNWIEEDMEIKKQKIEVNNIVAINKRKDKGKSKSKNKPVNVIKNNSPDDNNEWSESIPAAEETQENSNDYDNKKKDNSSMPKISEWAKPLQDGEIEYFVPSRKVKLKEANKDTSSKSLVLNPFAKKSKGKSGEKKVILGKSTKVSKKLNIKSVSHTSKSKKVKIVLHRNMAQKPSDYIQQVKSSPQLPYDSRKKPTKSLLKPNLLPSPINPFYQRKIGLKFDNAL